MENTINNSNRKWDSSNFLKLAREYRQLGWCPIPLDGKKPRNKWKRYQEQQSTIDQCKIWWREGQKANIGIVTGAISNLAVVDVDGPEGMASLKQAGITLPDTVTVETGGGGWHYYYRNTGGQAKTRAGILDHVDIRAEGGQVVAPPSIHPETGKAYRFADGKAPDEIEIAEFPAELIAVKSEEKPAEKAALVVFNGVPEGQRDDSLFRYACSLKARGMGRGEAAVLVSFAAAKCDPPFPENEALAKVDSAWKYPDAANKTLFVPNIITSAELARMEFAEVHFVYEGLLPVGLAVLAGRPKIGKSWLALLIARSVALGRDLLGILGPFEAGIAQNLPQSGDVLYLALEDNLRRLKDRDSQVSAKAKYIGQENGRPVIEGEMFLNPENLFFVTIWPDMENGCIEQIETFLDSHPNTKLVIIDVIQRVIIRKGRQSMYADDYDALKPLQELAAKRNIAILGVHHLRKAKADDPLEVVSGSFGLTAAVDNVFVLQRVRGRLAKLYITGRDIREEQELALQHDKDAWWTVLGTTEEAISDERKAIIAVIEAEGPIAPVDIAKKLDKNENTTRNLCVKMFNDGLVDKQGKGKYIALDSSDSANTQTV